MKYYAHSGNKDDFSDWQGLREHLHGVAYLARRLFAEATPSDKEVAL